MAEAEAVRQAVADNQVTLMCAHNQLFMPAVAKTRELLDAGILGTVYELRTTDSFFSKASGTAGMDWRAHVSTAGGGELIDTGYHPTYLLLHLAASRPTQVAAMLSTHRLTFMEGEDSAQVLVRFDSGAVGTIVTSWANTPAPGTERFSIVAEKGSLSSDGTTINYQLNGQDPVTIKQPEVDNMSADRRLRRLRTRRQTTGQYRGRRHPGAEGDSRRLSVGQDRHDHRPDDAVEPVGGIASIDGGTIGSLKCRKKQTLLAEPATR